MDLLCRDLYAFQVCFLFYVAFFIICLTKTLKHYLAHKFIICSFHSIYLSVTLLPFINHTMQIWILFLLPQHRCCSDSNSQPSFTQGCSYTSVLSVTLNICNFFFSLVPQLFPFHFYYCHTFCCVPQCEWLQITHRDIPVRRNPVLSAVNKCVSVDTPA